MFSQKNSGQMAPVWHDRQCRVILKMTLAAELVGKVSRRINPHVAHLGFDDRGDNDDDEISLKKKNSPPFIAALMPI